MGGVLGAGVDHHYLVDSDEVGVGARTGHGTGVGGDDAPHHGTECSGDTGFENLGHRSIAVGSGVGDGRGGSTHGHGQDPAGGRGAEPCGPGNVGGGRSSMRTASPT